MEKKSKFFAICPFAKGSKQALSEQGPNSSFIQFEILQDAYDPVLEGILSDSPTSKLVCFFLYCVIAPLSEETIYRGFLLTALSSSMKWRDAVVMSSLAFSVAHLSGESSIQLFAIGCITGLTYCRTGTLVASFAIHSLYNAVTLYMVLAS
jgi:membrane protease YdiL (CAAX protease family)